MSGKFASITADLLARKGTATPSAVVGKPAIDWTASVQYFTAPKQAHESAPADAQVHLHRDDAHYLRKIQIGISDHDHERLRILSARKETSRQQIVRDALVAYFETQAHAYKGECRCLSGTGSCKTNCCA
jgi:hypothetical protein